MTRLSITYSGGQGRERTINLRREGGFTLIETVLAMSIFSLILLIAYQTLVTGAQAKQRVSESASLQTQQRSAYRTLANAFDAGARVIGAQHTIEIDLTTGDSIWLEEAKNIEFALTPDGELWAYVDVDQQASLLLSQLDQAKFSYFAAGERHSQWNSKLSPSAVDLSWVEGGELRRWRFETR